jgi:hypothetical protein
MLIEFYGGASRGELYVVTNKQGGLQVCTYNSMGWPVEAGCIQLQTSKQAFKYANRIQLGGLWRQGVCSYNKQAGLEVYT